MDLNRAGDRLKGHAHACMMTDAGGKECRATCGESACGDDDHDDLDSGGGQGQWMASEVGGVGDPRRKREKKRDGGGQRNKYCRSMDGSAERLVYGR